jgi:O-antigen ligase
VIAARPARRFPPAAADDGFGGSRRTLAAAFGIWLGGYTLPAWFNDAYREELNVVFFAGLAVLALVAWERGGGRIVALRGAWLLANLFAAVILASALANLGTEHGRAVLTYAFVLIATLYAALALARLTLDEPAAVLVPYAALTVASFLIGYLVEPEAENGRFGGILNPNSAAMVLASGCCAALVARPRALRNGLLAAGALLVLATGSRSALLGLVAAAAVLLARGLLGPALPKRLALALAGLLALAALWAWGADWAVGSVARHLALWDRHRGVGTGFTNRVLMWDIALELWPRAPLLGHGPRANELLYEAYGRGNPRLAHLSSTHSGWLAVLVDLGAVGLALYLAAVGRALARAWRAPTGGDAVAQAKLALLVTYAFIATFERFAINAGNPVSVLFVSYLLAYNGVPERPRPGEGSPTATAAARGRPAFPGPRAGRAPPCAPPGGRGAAVPGGG